MTCCPLWLAVLPLQTVTKAMTTVCRVCSQDVLPSLTSYVSSLISNTGLEQVTREEFNIFLTPEGELYDRTIIEKWVRNHTIIKKGVWEITPLLKREWEITPLLKRESDHTIIEKGVWEIMPLLLLRNESEITPLLKNVISEHGKHLCILICWAWPGVLPFVSSG